MDSQAYKVVKARAKAQSKALVLAGQDIGAMPPVRDVARRARADTDFRFFCESYFPRLFTLAWSHDHLKVIARIEQAVIRGGLFAMAMPRGSGKTTLCQTAALWALLTGRHPFVFLIAATAEYASAALNNLKSHLAHNELLLEDYPEAVYPIRCLEGESRRCSGQRYYGRLTHVGWTADQIVLPTIPGSRCSGTIVRTAGLLGNVRGAMHIRPDGVSVRPSLVVIDDPQTDQSARSPAQVHERLAVVNGAILNLAGPGKRIAAVMPCTVIRNDDLADQILDRAKHPEWQGERTRLVYSFPANEKLWAEYARLRSDSLRNDGDGHEATEFYREHQVEMDAGAAVAWPARHNADEISAIQHAMNLKLRDEAAFWAEYQNQPLPEAMPDEGVLAVDQIVAKTNGMRRGEVPMGVNHVVAFIDVQATLLYWMVCGWEDDFSGCILDYGAYPDPKRAYFTLKDAKRTLAVVHKGTGQEGAIYAGLEALVGRLCCRQFRRDDGAELRIERLLIDANWGNSTDVIYQFCRQCLHGTVVMPSHGRYVGASSVPFSDYKRKAGERIGLHWRMPNVQGRRSVRHVVIDTNYWKSFVHARLAVPMGDPGCLSLFAPSMGLDHQLLAEHLTAEYRVKTEARGRAVDEWKAKPGNPDNHWLDCLVGCAVAGSMQGAVLFGVDQKQGPPRPRMKLSMIQGRRG
ncbi:terminase gpA endonuclease subunit [Fontivita pretiosa]|uniref:terminase gpA endonuclease subunit n=1 Tax=Fontivita pretiosa TaxID=2989684 RepID=UPI003D16585D